MLIEQLEEKKRMYISDSISSFSPCWHIHEFLMTFTRGMYSTDQFSSARFFFGIKFFLIISRTNIQLDHLFD